MQFVTARFEPRWRLYISSEVNDAVAAAPKFTEAGLALPSGAVAEAVEIDFSGERVNFNLAFGKTFPVKTHALFVGRLVADADGVVMIGAGADWWWSCWADGEKVFDRGERYANGNASSIFAKHAWVFPVKVREGANDIVFHLVSGQFWSFGAGVIPAMAGLEFREQPPPAPEALEGLRLVGNTTRDPVSYGVGEEMEFVFELDDPRGASGDGLFLMWFANGDDGATDSGIAPISVAAPVRVRTRLARPGFVHVYAKLVNSCGLAIGNDARLCFDGGAGADIGALRPAATRPADFDAYWERQRARLDAVPPEAVCEEYLGACFPDGVRIPDGLRIYKVRVACAGPNPVTGLLAVPKDGGRHPARVIFDGYSKEPKLSHRLMTPGVVTFHVNAHGYELFRGPQYYADFFLPFETKCSYGISPEENADPDTSYFNGMALRVMRAFDFIRTRPEWNGRDLFAMGGSQGGLQAIWAASLVPDLTRCECSINWCSNIAGADLDARLPGWNPPYVRGLDYYDTVFHAARIPATCFVDVQRVGLGDYTCPPSGVTAMYNAIPGPRRIAYYQNSTHMYVQPEPTLARRWN